MTLTRSTNGDSSDEEEGKEKEEEETTHYVLGGDAVGTAIADQLRTDGHRVALIDTSDESGAVPGAGGDPTASTVLSKSGIDASSTVVVATRSDPRNLLIAQLVRARFDVPRVVAFVDDPDRLPLFVEAGHEPFCVTTALSETLAEEL